MVFKELETWFNSGIFAIQCVGSDQVYLCHSECMIDAAIRHLHDIRASSHDIKELNQPIDQIELVILETNLPNKRDRMIKLQDYINNYIQQGKQVLNRRDSLIYKIVYDIKQFRVYISLKSKSGARFPIAVFKNMKDARRFINTTYPDGKVHKVIYSNNYLTREFLYNIKYNIEKYK